MINSLPARRRLSGYGALETGWQGFLIHCRFLIIGSNPPAPPAKHITCLSTRRHGNARRAGQVCPTLL
jgi:hypothetical protein